jgi:hypothetical protein
VTVLIFKIIKSYTYSKYCHGVQFWLHVYVEISKIIHVNHKIASITRSINLKHDLENKLAVCLQPWVNGWRRTGSSARLGEGTTESANDGQRVDTGGAPLNDRRPWTVQRRTSRRRTPADYTARAREAREERARLGREKERARLGFYRDREGEQRSSGACFMANNSVDINGGRSNGASNSEKRSVDAPLNFITRRRTGVAASGAEARIPGVCCGRG